tara:strand:+ start:84 stop:1064 length:981 start_codon:yes stop_codon:yes gene_type:complete
MEDIFCHIVGLNYKIKDKIIDILKSKDFNFDIIDLDLITEKIINDKNMNLMYDKYEQYFIKSKKKEGTKDDTKKYKEIDKKMINYWKYKFQLLLEKEVKKSKKKVVLIGLNTHFKNNRIYVKINCKLKFFIKVDLVDNAKLVIQNNLDQHRNEIIEGSFPLEYLEIDFLIKKRENLINIYKKIGYEVKSLTSIIKIINNNNNFDMVNVNDLYFASRDKQSKKINFKEDRIIAYSIPWLAALSCIESKNLKKGFKKNNGFIKQLKKGELNNLKKECYLYKIEKDNFYHHENGKGIKYACTENVKILDNYYIKNIYNYLLDNGISLIK